jgi:hypothetical protein
VKLTCGIDSVCSGQYTRSAAMVEQLTLANAASWSSESFGTLRHADALMAVDDGATSARGPFSIRSLTQS